MSKYKLKIYAGWSLTSFLTFLAENLALIIFSHFQTIYLKPTVNCMIRMARLMPLCTSQRTKSFQSTRSNKLLTFLHVGHFPPKDGFITHSLQIVCPQGKLFGCRSSRSKLLKQMSHGRSIWKTQNPSLTFLLLKWHCAH